jgi:glycosyltransferase involved in cell wall biosynthesis
MEAADWPGNTVLVLHERAHRSRAEPYIKDIIEASDPSRVYLSLDPVPYDQLNLVFTSAHIGLAFYHPKDLNYQNLAYASGKLAFYLCAGLPVIVNDLPDLAKLVTDHRCGVVVREAGEIGTAISTIFRNYDEYSANARNCFSERFDFERKFQPIINELKKLCDQL